MPRYKQLGPRDDVSVEEGDEYFLGFRSRVQPGALPAGVARYLENMRCDRGTARPRNGTKALSTDLTLANPPVVLDFALPTAKAITSITRVGTTATVTTTASHGLATSDSVAIEGATGGDAGYYNGQFTITVTGAATFTYTMSGTPAGSATGTLVAYKGPRVYGVYDDQVRGSCVYASSTNVEGVVMAATTKAYVYRAGVAIVEIDYPSGQTVAAADECDLFYFLGKVYLFRGTAKTVLQWDCNTANDFVAVTAGAHPSGGTLIRMPNVGWAVDFNRSFILPYSRDEHIRSDFGDVDTYDTQYGELRIRPGSADWLIGVHPYHILRYVVLYRKSVHVVECSLANLSPVSVEEITRAFGCVARKSVATCGDTILWLSDLGVTGLRITGDLNLVPLNLPLSDQINDQIETINWTYAGKARGIFWNNRYYLAVPTGSSTRNNTLLVFNFLNRHEGAPIGEWESVDTFRGDFDVQEFHVLDYEGQKRLHASTTFGYLFLLEELESDEWGNPSSSLGTYPIVAKLYTRDMQLGTRDRKRFTRLRLNTNVTVADAFATTFRARNPDRTVALPNYTATASTDVSHALRVPGVRGAAGTVEITTSAGRPEIRSIALEATTADHANHTRE